MSIVMIIIAVRIAMLPHILRLCRDLLLPLSLVLQSANTRQLTPQSSDGLLQLPDPGVLGGVLGVDLQVDVEQRRRLEHEGGGALQRRQGPSSRQYPLLTLLRLERDQR